MDVLEQNQRGREQQLASVRFAMAGDPACPTVLGLLTVGKEPRQFLPGAYVQFLRIDGDELTDPILDQSEVAGALPYLLRTLDEKMRAHVKVAADIASEDLETRHADYPLVALQQLARNAVLHRTYEGTHSPVRITWFNDRVEILSPGGPFGQVTRENFGGTNMTDYRNPNLAEVMKNLGYVQKFGMGIPLTRSELDKNGNPPPEFTVEDAFVFACVRRRPCPQP